MLWHFDGTCIIRFRNRKMLYSRHTYNLGLDRDQLFWCKLGNGGNVNNCVCRLDCHVFLKVKGNFVSVEGGGGILVNLVIARVSSFEVLHFNWTFCLCHNFYLGMLFRRVANCFYWIIVSLQCAIKVLSL